MIKCANVSTCYLESWRCDGEADCFDKSDEINCNRNISCSEDKFECSNGQCIDISWRCDGEIDCPNDELNCRDNGTILNCKPNSFKCADGKMCIPSSWQCDGKYIAILIVFFCSISVLCTDIRHIFFSMNYLWLSSSMKFNNKICIMINVIFFHVWVGSGAKFRSG